MVRNKLVVKYNFEKYNRKFYQWSKTPELLKWQHDAVCHVIDTNRVI